jgi:hypothetical protein
VKKGTEVMSAPSPEKDPKDSEARRAFLARCGRFAVVTPPKLTMLLSVSSVPNEANASTIGHHKGHKKGWGSWDD